MFRSLTPLLCLAPFSTVLLVPLSPPLDNEETDPHDVSPPVPSSTSTSTRTRDAGLSHRVLIPTTVRGGMALIPGGRFAMGSRDAKAPPNERPMRSVALDSFQIDLTEVTVADYRACVDRHACPVPVRSSAWCTFEKDDPQLPINCVTWAMANAFCQSVGKRLPHESEWEAAAHGPDSTKYPWSGSGSTCATATTLLNDHTGKRCSKDAPSRVGTHPLGRSVYGVDDMSGNVEEWTSDYYAEAVGELSPTAGASRVIRGGGWLSAPAAATTTIRSWGSAMEAGPNVGFRCAKNPPRDGGN